MRKCADCERLRQRISDLNNELLVLRIAAMTVSNKTEPRRQKTDVGISTKAGAHSKSLRRQPSTTSSRSPVFTS